MKTGDDGSETSLDDREEFVKGGCIESPFMFRGRLGPGEVMGRCVGSETVRDAIDGRPPKVGPGKEDSGMRLFMGDSGEDEGDWSERDDESVHEAVVVGDESADPAFWVEVLSWCL